MKYNDIIIWYVVMKITSFYIEFLLFFLKFSGNFQKSRICLQKAEKSRKSKSRKSRSTLRSARSMYTSNILKVWLGNSWWFRIYRVRGYIPPKSHFAQSLFRRLGIWKILRAGTSYLCLINQLYMMFHKCRYLLPKYCLGGTTGHIGQFGVGVF